VDRKKLPSAEVQTIIEGFVEAAGKPRRHFTQDDLLERTLFPMINEAARILEEGIAQRASDIDVVWVNGYGWPRTKGGPMYWADQIGASHIVDRLAAFGLPVARLLAEHARSGARFTN
jgi:3-hydroxyacyl-CoA dehydrogenase